MKTPPLSSYSRFFFFYMLKSGLTNLEVEAPRPTTFEELNNTMALPLYLMIVKSFVHVNNQFNKLISVAQLIYHTHLENKQILEANHF